MCSNVNLSELYKYKKWSDKSTNIYAWQATIICQRRLRKSQTWSKILEELAKPSNILHQKWSLNIVVVVTYKIKYGDSNVEVFLNTFRIIIEEIYNFLFFLNWIPYFSVKFESRSIAS